MQRPGISVIITTHNQAAYLERTLCSVLDQGDERLEVIVIDRGSTDGTADILREYRGDIAAWETVRPHPAGAALSRGLALATGEMVGVLARQDLYLPGALEAVGVMSAGLDGADWLVGQGLRIDSQDRALGRVNAGGPTSLLSLLVQDHDALPGAGSFYRRDMLLACGGFDETLPEAVEHELHARLLSAGRRPTVVPEVLAASREPIEAQDFAATLQRGLAHVRVAELHAAALPLAHRQMVYEQCEERRRVYALAEAEVRTDASRGPVWDRLLRRPEWLGDDRYRQSLLHGGHGAAMPRTAA